MAYRPVSKACQYPAGDMLSAGVEARSNLLAKGLQVGLATAPVLGYRSALHCQVDFFYIEETKRRELDLQRGRKHDDGGIDVLQPCQQAGQAGPGVGVVCAGLEEVRAQQGQRCSQVRPGTAETACAQPTTVIIWGTMPLQVFGAGSLSLLPCITNLVEMPA